MSPKFHLNLCFYFCVFMFPVIWCSLANLTSSSGHTIASRDKSAFICSFGCQKCSSRCACTSSPSLITSAEGKEKRSTWFLLYALISKNSTSGHFCYTNFCEIANFYHVENAYHWPCSVWSMTRDWWNQFSSVQLRQTRIGRNFSVAE